MKLRTKLLLLTAGLSSAYIYSKIQAERRVNEMKPVFKRPAPYIFAHRGGKGNYPEHTRLAFNNAVNQNVDGFEIDVRLTKDNEIVVLHDLYVDRVTEYSGKVSDYTLDELRKLDFGYNFKDVRENYAYRGHPDAGIVTLRELFKEYPHQIINIDMKDSIDTEAGQKIAPLLFELILDEKATDRVIVTSFEDEQIRRFTSFSGDLIALGAGTEEVTKAYTLYHSGLGHLYQPSRDTFQIPINLSSVKLDNAGFIRYLDDLNVKVGYWVINDTNEMTRLLNLGAHTIVTDYPDKANLLINY
ncbi:glycerophosphodiester phosphodiesterase [Nosocomiicoccus sp. HMSC09A07]|uniref:glycerophosphodiester phosphodiesterase n=1 Tax=Nosocomiicoccus sp. HMSC09A07 TaxID=1581145 RepID=UPI0008A43B49|nr:glycerophosphodiester phosphodiesterase [Nosocomiicoccus sp. HMSC09A07]OFS62515.1 glycerophosphodiester phosphodiesterase [Nosocomiicoccus sp. HMSC09A07]